MTTSQHALAARAIRAELKKAFPGVKFSVRSDSYSMGDSVRISWTDGVTTDQVSEIADKYQYGHFNGMEDIYEYSNKNVDIPQTKFVQVQRDISDEVYQQVFDLHLQHYSDFESVKDLDVSSRLDVSLLHGGYYQTARSMIRRILNCFDLRLNLTHDTLLKASNFERQWAA